MPSRRGASRVRSAARRPPRPPSQHGPAEWTGRLIPLTLFVIPMHCGASCTATFLAAIALGAGSQAQDVTVDHVTVPARISTPPVASGAPSLMDTERPPRERPRRVIFEPSAAPGLAGPIVELSLGIAVTIGAVNAGAWDLLVCPGSRCSDPWRVALAAGAIAGLAGGALLIIDGARHVGRKRRLHEISVMPFLPTLLGVHVGVTF